jgi:hypothetical protein
LTEDGFLWRKSHKGDEWVPIRGPGDETPFRREPTLEEQAAAIRRGWSGPIEFYDDEI